MKASNILSHMKTLLILVLGASAIYLTVQLWFNELSGSSFSNAALAFFSRTQPEAETEQNFLVKPARIVTAFGDNNFDIIYNALDSSRQKRDCDEAITLALESGEYVSTQQSDAASQLAAPGYAYNYTAAVSATAFINSYPQRRSMLTSRVRSFNWLFVRPNEDGGIGVIFLDTEGRAHEYLVLNAILETRISDNISNLADDSLRLKYTYDGRFFIPQVDGFIYPAVVTENPYMDQGGLLLDFIKRKVDLFFGSAGSKWESSTAQSFIYSDENLVVKYNPAESQNGLDVLEYANYNVIDRRILNTFSADYNTAVRFIVRDTAISNEFYLAAVTGDSGRRVFSFNYAINDLPIYVSHVSSDLTGLAYPIEVVVENGVVTRYRKLVYTFTIAGEQEAGEAFESVIGDLLAVGESITGLPLTGVTLGYKADTSAEMSLYWFVELDGMTYVKSAQGVK